MKEIVTDLMAEQKALDDFLCSFKDEQWDLPTPAEGWTVRDSVSHIAHIDEVAVSFLEGDYAALDEAAKMGVNFNELGPRRGRAMTPSQILEWWRGIRERLCDHLMAVDPKARIPWFGPAMGARSFATARLMETWAHGLDCYDAVGIEPVDTDRLRHVAMIAYMARPYAYSVNGLKMPETLIRIELVLPSSEIWSQGPEDAKDIIRGSAGEFCRVAVRRRHWKDTSLEIIGEEARRFIEIVQTYAGPPGSGRRPRNC
ncbi:MAG TPA: TIGR03084 family protein [Dehalococcoidia bacterium]|nr:TIGR03084 family protein [Dehalococcoidia bacterium]